MTNKYPYAFAQYPQTFIGCKVSPTKICMQFGDPTIKLRIMDGDRKMLPKQPSCHPYAEVTENGVDFSVIATGCQMPVIEELQRGLCVAYDEYLKLHQGTYNKEYNKNYIDFLKEIKVEFERLITKWDR